MNLEGLYPVRQHALGKLPIALLSRNHTFCHCSVCFTQGGKCPEIWPIFALKHEHLPPILSTGVNAPGQIASHLASSTDTL